MSVGGEYDLEISRVLRVPRELVWQAWSDPAHLKEWWCPKPWTTEVRAFDLRPGGAFHTFMRGPDGGTSDNPAPSSRWFPSHASSGPQRCSNTGAQPPTRGCP
jgi:uncharacterized protein YndB with AHSA1/START domain